MFRKELGGSSPPLVALYSHSANKEFDKDSIDTKGFERFLRVQKNLADQTVKAHIYVANIFLKRPEMVNDFKFPSVTVKPKTLPSKEQLKSFFHALPDAKYNIIFMALVSSGLRISELLSADIDRKNRMLVPQSHDGKNKKGWISFYNDETEALLREYHGNPFENSRNTVARKCSCKEL